MKGFFYFPINIQRLDNQGVVKKCLALSNAFRERGATADVFMLSNDGILKNEQLWQPLNTTFQGNKYLSYLIYYRLIFNYLVQKNDFKNYDFIYIRFTFLTLSFIHFLQKIKSQNLNIIIIIEFPTFPYWTEARDIARKIIFGVDVIFRSKFQQLTHRCITFTEHSEIFGVPTLQMTNGIEVKKTPFTDKIPPFDGKKLNLICIANLNFWSGFDRLLRGVAAYEKKENILVTIVGIGTELPHLQALTKKLDLEKQVIFCGVLHGQSLSTALENAHIGVGSLGLHRAGLIQAAPLKHREYCARGLPFILATQDADFQENTPFAKYVPSNESDVNLAEVMDFYGQLRVKHPNYKNEIRKFSEENLDWKRKIEPILQYLAVALPPKPLQ